MKVKTRYKDELMPIMFYYEITNSGSSFKLLRVCGQCPAFQLDFMCCLSEAKNKVACDKGEVSCILKLRRISKVWDKECIIEANKNKINKNSLFRRCWKLLSIATTSPWVWAFRLNQITSMSNLLINQLSIYKLQMSFKCNSLYKINFYFYGLPR